MSETESKSALRGELRRALKALGAVERARASREIGARLRELAAWKNARWIYAFSPLPSEPDLTLWDWFGKSLALPRITETGLQFFEVPGFRSLEIHLLGMGEPPADAPPAAPPEVVLVSGLGFDRSGGRLGRGGGYYDRFLATLPTTVPRIGVGFEIQMRETIPAEPHDVRLDAVVTECGAWTFAGLQNSP